MSTKHVVTVPAAAGFCLAALTVAATPAYALTIHHVAPAAGIAGQALDLVIEVDRDCTRGVVQIGSCSDVTVVVSYDTPDGNSGTVSGTISAAETDVTATTTIALPADAVRTPSISYDIAATQSYCFLSCSVWTARDPSSGQFTVPVVSAAASNLPARGPAFAWAAMTHALDCTVRSERRRSTRRS